MILRDVLPLALLKHRSNNWSIEKCQQWLDKNPISNLDKIKYLKDKIAKYKVVQDKANASKQLVIEVLEKNWTSKVSYLRLIHCLVHDETIKFAYRQRNDIEDSQVALDNQNLDM